MKIQLRKKDTVLVMTGKDRGKKGEVLRVLAADGRRPPLVVVSKVNIIAVHRKARGSEPGGIQRKEGPIAASNVMLMCPKCQRGVRPRRDALATGERVRLCRRCGEVIL